MFIFPDKRQNIVDFALVMLDYRCVVFVVVSCLAFRQWLMGGGYMLMLVVSCLYHTSPIRKELFLNFRRQGDMPRIILEQNSTPPT